MNDVVTSVPAAVHARAWKHLTPANQKEWSDVVAAASEDFANGCLFKVPETGKGKAEVDTFIVEPADAAKVDGEEPSDLLAEEPECAVPENVQGPDEQELLPALMGGTVRGHCEGCRAGTSGLEQLWYRSAANRQETGDAQAPGCCRSSSQASCEGLTVRA